MIGESPHFAGLFGHVRITHFLEGDEAMSQSISVHQPKARSIPGYDYGQPSAAHSPVSLEELREIEEAAGWTEEDALILKRHHEIFEQNAERMVDAWRKVIASQPHLAKWFTTSDGKTDDEYKARSRRGLSNGSSTFASGRTTRHGLIIRRKSASGTLRRKRTKQTARGHSPLSRSDI